MPHPNLRFSPYAWAKLLYLRDRGDSEIGGFGLSSEEDPLAVVDVLTVNQRCTPVTVAFDDGAVADLFDELVDQGIPPHRFGRIWIHTHPGQCPLPSSTDEATFERAFGRTDWSVMAIVARGGESYARLAFHVGPGGTLKIPVRVDYRQPFDASNEDAWEQEYLAHVAIQQSLALPMDSYGPFLDDAAGQFVDLCSWEEEIDGSIFETRPF